MALEIPPIDSRTYRELLDEALARIPVHNPEYTNFNDADPGVTLLQLFAFLAESVTYRANLIPERNRRAFLRLLGVPLAAAEPARGLVAFDNPRGAADAVKLAADVELLAAQVPFRTLNAVEVLPVEARAYVKSRLPEDRRPAVAELYRRLYASHAASPLDSFDFYETRAFAGPRSGAVLPVLDLGGDTVDASLWLALLARPGDDPELTRQAIGSRVLTLGVVPAVDGSGLVLPAGGAAAGAAAGGLVVEVPRVGDDPVARYRRLEVRADGDLLARPGVAEVVLPPAAELVSWDDLDPLEAGVGDFPPPLEDTDEGARLVTWLRLRAPQAAGTDASGSQLRARLSWVGVNAAAVVQQARVIGERLPAGTGEPDQTASLVNTPVLAPTVRLTVDGELWQPIDDLAAAAAEVPLPGAAAAAAADARVFTVDRPSGEIRFGDGAHGARPPAGAVISASYAYGGGRRGMVGIGAITQGPALPAGVRVANPVPTWGGDEAETVAAAERRIPGFLRHRDRLVSQQDFLDVAAAAPGVDLGRVEVLPLFHPEHAAERTPGAVTLLVLPLWDAAQPDAPRPDQLFLGAVARHLEPRRLVTTELHVRGPVYVPISVSVGIDVVPGRDQAPVRQAVERAIRRFLSPLEGGFAGTGWPLAKAVERLEVAAAASRVPGVSKVGEVLLGNAAGVAVETVALAGLELPRIVALATAPGAALPLDQLHGAPGDTPPTRLPVPVVPDEC